MTMWQLKAFLTPKPCYFLVVHPPALDPEQGGDFAIAIAAILLGQADQSEAKTVIIVLCAWSVLNR